MKLLIQSAIIFFGTLMAALALGEQAQAHLEKLSIPMELHPLR